MSAWHEHVACVWRRGVLSGMLGTTCGAEICRGQPVQARVPRGAVDADRFDALARAWTDSASRRSLVGIVLGGAVAGHGPLAGLARKKVTKKERKKKKRCQRACDGCCGGSNGFNCEPGHFVRACGKDGEPCKNCAASDRFCLDQRCCRLLGAACGFDDDCCKDAECRSQKCCIPAPNDCDKDCPENGPCEECCSGTCSGGNCCSAAGEVCTRDADCCGDESLCEQGICTADSCTPRCPDGIGDDPGMSCCAMTSDGRHNECLWDEKVNCRLKTGNMGLVGCPLYTNACCLGGDGYITCSGAGTCQSDETKEPAVTCLD
jgi:hypothetical protein